MGSDRVAVVCKVEDGGRAGAVGFVSHLLILGMARYGLGTGYTLYIGTMYRLWMYGICTWYCVLWYKEGRLYCVLEMLMRYRWNVRCEIWDYSYEK